MSHLRWSETQVQTRFANVTCLHGVTVTDIMCTVYTCIRIVTVVSTAYTYVYVRTYIQPDGLYAYVHYMKTNIIYMYTYIYG